MDDTIPPVDPSADVRKAIRQQCWKAYYEAYYSQLLADLVAGRWQKLDQGSKLLVALFTTGSAVAGWGFWTSSGNGKVAWAICSGIAAVLSVVQSSLGVSDRLKAMLESRARMLRIRLELEALYNMIQLNPTFDVAKATQNFEALQREYVEAAAQMPKDWIYTTRAERNVQETLDQKLGVSSDQHGH
jgi:hypothetical protein